MRFRAGAIRFAVEPDTALVDAERRVLARLDRDEAQGPPDLRLALLDEPPWSQEDPGLYPMGAPAVLRWAGGRLLQSHATFTAEIDPLAGEARLFRRGGHGYALEAVVRASMLARLPALGGLPFHAAGIVIDGRGFVFFGPSGAGKTTLASTSSYPVLSDELVVVSPAPFSLERSGFWGEATAAAAVASAPLAGVLELARGPALRVRSLPPLEAASRIAGSVPVPFAPLLWTRALAAIERLVRTVPVLRMEWSPQDPPLPRLGALLTAIAGVSPRR